MKAHCISVLCIILTLGIAKSEGSLYEYVTCGSVLKLLNAAHNARLHSHDVRYGSGSGQQSVTAVDESDDANSYWRVRAATGTEDCRRGEPIRCGSLVRLTHLATGKNLHSHLYSSPISHQQEVSAYGGNGDGDRGDDWQVVCGVGGGPDVGNIVGGPGLWRRSERVRMRHSVTEQYLHVSGERFGRPIAGQAEVSAVPAAGSGSYWTAAEGIYVKPSIAGTGGPAPTVQRPEFVPPAGLHDSGEL